MTTDTVEEQTIEQERFIPWDEIKALWCDGETSRTLASRFNVSESGIRNRAMRCQWPRAKPTVVKRVAQRATEKAVRQELERNGPAIAKAAKEEIRRCLDASRALGETFVQQALRRAETCEDGHASSIASLGKAGVSVWRESVGLSNSGDGANPTALNVHVVLRRDGGAMLPVSAEQPTIDV